MELVELLRFVEIFQGLTDRQIKKLACCFEKHELTQDEILFHQGDKADRMYIVQSGFVEIIINDCVVGILGQGQSIGEIAWLDRSVRSGTIRALVDTIIPSIPFASLTALCRKNAKLGHSIMRNLAADLSFRLRQRNRA